MEYIMCILFCQVLFANIMHKISKIYPFYAFLCIFLQLTALYTLFISVFYTMRMQGRLCDVCVPHIYMRMQCELRICTHVLKKNKFFHNIFLLTKKLTYVKLKVTSAEMPFFHFTIFRRCALSSCALPRAPPPSSRLPLLGTDDRTSNMDASKYFFLPSVEPHNITIQTKIHTIINR